MNVEFVKMEPSVARNLFTFAGINNTYNTCTSKQLMCKYIKLMLPGHVYKKKCGKSCITSIFIQFLFSKNCVWFNAKYFFLYGAPI